MAPLISETDCRVPLWARSFEGHALKLHLDGNQGGATDDLRPDTHAPAEPQLASLERAEVDAGAPRLRRLQGRRLQGRRVSGIGSRSGGDERPMKSVIGRQFSHVMTKARFAVVPVVTALILTGCGSNPVPALRPSPSPVRTPATWSEDLTLSGDINAHATATAPDSGGTTSSCSGKFSTTSGYSLILSLPTDHGIFQLFATVHAYSGPGTYTSGPSGRISAGIINPERTSSWTTAPDDPVTFTVNPSQESGTIDAAFSLHNHDTAATKEMVKGMWSCRSGG